MPPKADACLQADRYLLSRMSETDEQDEVGKLGGDPETTPLIRRWLGLAKELVKPKPEEREPPERR